MTSTLHDVLLHPLQESWRQLSDRLEGLTEQEYRWEPFRPCWSVEQRPDGSWFGQIVRPEPQPAPVTTIAWRLWHIGEDCFESYSRRAFGSTAGNLPEGDWVGGHRAATDYTGQCIAHFGSEMAALTDAQLFRELGPDWGPFANRTYADLLQHATRELTHHGAEIGLLRDIFSGLAQRSRTPSNPQRAIPGVSPQQTGDRV